ncbi:hypothetical protein [Mycolicibacterium elephantis]|uniref:hypothetical protein n=1 Tax=Mycolicibacterium elephantis TaxID=81858 RepID=UPI001039BDA5|nr:hypothetical protein [Mycolicibacterium elephantis]
MTPIFYNDLSLDQLHPIGCSREIRDIIEDEPLAPVSADNREAKIEGLVTRPRGTIGQLLHGPTVYWRRAVPRAEARLYESIEGMGGEDGLGDDDDFGDKAYDHIIFYRLLTPDEKIKFRKRTGIMVVSVRNNRDCVPYIAKWWSGPS